MNGRSDALRAVPVTLWGVAIAWACLRAARILLRVLSLASIEALFCGTRPRGRRGAPGAMRRAERAASAVSKAASLPPLGGRCLERSLALRLLLALSGVPTDLRIGVRRVPDGIVAHAWVSCLGRPIGEPLDPETEFRPLRSPGQGR